MLVTPCAKLGPLQSDAEFAPRGGPHGLPAREHLTHLDTLLTQTQAVSPHARVIHGHYGSMCHWLCLVGLTSAQSSVVLGERPVCSLHREGEDLDFSFVVIEDERQRDPKKEVG